MVLPMPFFIEGPPLDLIKVSLGYAAMFEMNVHHAPFRSRTVALKRETVLCIGDIHPYAARFHKGNSIFCIELLLNWFFVSEESIFFHFMVCIYNNLFLKKLAKSYRFKRLVTSTEYFYIYSFMMV
uniref:Uncharacterized protein n=1 Tax=Rousettus aegyptiacus TaxID=9407 RepID=A0A7J8KAZ5_ROUAE|nr:hypothetical protein HJG63_007864 [Rousettus aegyptiacus]